MIIAIHPQKEKGNLVDRDELLEEVFELAFSNDMNYFG